MGVGSYKGVQWVWVFIYKCFMGVGTYIQLYYECWCLYTGVPWVWVLIKVYHGFGYLYTFVSWIVGACIQVYHGCGYLYTGVPLVWILIKVYNGCGCLYTSVSWVWLLIYSCIMNSRAHIQVYHVGICVQMYHECKCLCMAVPPCRHACTAVS